MYGGQANRNGLIFNKLFIDNIRGTSSDAYYIDTHNLEELEEPAYWWLSADRTTSSTVGTGLRPDYGWLTNGQIDMWINTDKIQKVVTPFMVPRDIDDGNSDDCGYPTDGINALLNDSSEVA